MNKREINVFDYAETILKAMPKGILLTSAAGEKVNSMTIGWGTLGIEWGGPIFTAFIREGRYTRELLDEGDSFTVNIPLNNENKKAVGYLGVKSGRDTDKLADLGLTLVPSDEVEAPAIKEFPLTLECKVVLRQLQDKDAMAPEMMQWYPQDVDGSFHGANKDFHVAYYGQILKAYIIED